MPSMPWFRYYSETISDVKLARIARETGCSRMEVMGAWSGLLCVASQSPIRGALYVTFQKRFSIDDVTEALFTDRETAEKLIGAFIEMEMIEVKNGAWYLKNWDKRQFESDTSSERVRKYREKSKVNVSETEVKRFGNVSETPPDTESESETDTESDKNARAEADPLPDQTVDYPEWPAIPDARTAEKVFQQVTQMPTFPGRSRDSDIERICSIYDREKAKTVSYLGTYWTAWLNRGYNRVNTGWLDWAVSGQIPQWRGKNGNGAGASPPEQDAFTANAIKDPAVRVAFSYLTMNPRGSMRAETLQGLKQKGFDYDADNKKLIPGSVPEP